MSVERDIIDELDVVLANIRRAEQKTELDLEETIKSIKSEFSPKQSRESEEK